MKENQETRVESDLLGEIEVPLSALYGAQTRRAMLNFPLHTERAIGSYPELIVGLLQIKQAAASVNLQAGFMEQEKARAIMDAATWIIEEQRFDQFPVHRLHGGGGTSANMNVNEVLANVAEERLGGTRGEYRIVHPNDHVNLHQSTNDVYPTTCHIACIREWSRLTGHLDELITALLAKGAAWREQPRIARTCLQDAVEITFADLFGGYASFLTRARDRIGTAVDTLHVINLGGTIVGRRNDVPEKYLGGIIPALREITGDQDYVMAADLFDAAQNPDDLMTVSSELSTLALGLIKIAKDFRLMSSGPETGFGEIRLPRAQPGSSMMPGKINPVIPEFLIQLCFQTLGNHAVCEAALGHGELDLNVWESSMAFNILESMELLRNGVASFEEKCIRGLEMDADRNYVNANTIIPLLTELMKRHGYSLISQVCEQANGDMSRLRQLIQEKGLR